MLRLAMAVIGKHALIVVILSMFVLHALSSPDDSTAPMAKTEQESLYSVIKSFVGQWWNGSDLYPDPCGWTQIQGVSCDLYDGLWYITALNVGPVLENSLECSEDAEFNPLLFELKHLRSLSFFECFSSHKHITIPSSNWGKLAGTLETLEFRSNPSLIGEIPASIGELVNLQSLVLVENSLSGQLPLNLGNLVHLQRLVLSGNRFSGGIPDSLGNNLSELLILDLSRNSLTGNVPSSLGGLTSLMKLDLSNNLIQGSIPNELGKLGKLSLLDLKSNNLSGSFAQSIQSLNSLQDLILSNNVFGGSLRDLEWQKLANLTTMDLSRVGLTGSIPESISNLKSLRFLALDNNQLNGEVPPNLAAMPSLTALYLNGNNLTGELQFSHEFYLRMGRRFASWNNPYLCYNSGGSNATTIPYGVEQCKQGRENSNYDSGSRYKESNNNADQSSSLLASLGLPAASSVTGFWWGFVVQELVIVFLLVMLM